jgi:Dolichyl-phosphate-mannose-protein mannosyltransferase
MWNPLGYPDLRYDDGTYIGRAMHVLVTKDPQEEATFYDHPYFGQIFLAGLLWLVGFPNTFAPSADEDVIASVKLLWLVPKLLIGLLAVIDTILIYKIVERQYRNKTIAFIASTLFAIMPMWWSLRVLFLESLFLPIVLSSIFFAVYAKDPRENKVKKNVHLILVSGVLMGLAIFTKIPAFAFIPLVAYVILRNSNKSFKTLGLWFIPVIIVPLIWPAYALFHGHLDAWWEGIFWQTHRQYEGMTLRNTIIDNFTHSPLFSWLGLFGLVFAIIKRDYFVILWAIPFLIFLYFIGFVRDFHLIPLLPALCVSTSKLLVGLSSYVPYQRVRQVLSLGVVSIVAIFGLVSIAHQLATDENDNKFALAAFVTRYLEDNRNDNVTVISSHVYSWIPRYVFALGNNEYKIPEDIRPPKNEKVMLVVDDAFRLVTSLNNTMGEGLRRTYNLYSTNETMKVDMGQDKIVLPKDQTLGFKGQQEIDLINDTHVWKSRKDAEVSQDDRRLIILSKSNDEEKVSRHAIMQTEFKNITTSPLLLSLDYTLESPNTTTSFFLEIRKNDGTSSNNFNQVIFKYVLDNSWDNMTNRLLILPPETVDTPVEFRLGIDSYSSGEHKLAIKRASILFDA